MKRTLSLLFFILICGFANAQKDSLILINGNDIVGEIKLLEKSVLTIKTPYSDKDFQIKWHRVNEIYSTHLFIVSLTNGQRLNATINTDPDDKTSVLLNAGGYVLESQLKNVIGLESTGKSFLSRLSAEFDLGLTLTKANNSRQFNASAFVGYVANKWRAAGSFNSVLSTQTNVDDIKRIETDLTFQWYLKNDWFLSAATNFLTNNELKLDLRTTGKLGGGNYIKRNNNMYLGAGAGLAYNNERYTDALIEDKSSYEFYFGGEFNKYDIGDFSILTSLGMYTGITEKGRFRSDFKLDLKYDLPLDFYIKISTTYNYDNQPAEGASEGDYVFQTSFGWELD